MADPDAVMSAVTAIVAALGPADALVNSAGLGAWGAAVETDPSTFRRLVDVNYLGAVHATAAVWPSVRGS